MTAPADHSLALIDAYNRRDATTIEAMLHPDIVYIRPGPRRARSTDSIVRLYQSDWERNDATIAVRSTLAQGDRVAVEIEVTFPAGQVLQGAAFHRWDGHLLAEYRAYLDPPASSSG